MLPVFRQQELVFQEEALALPAACGEGDIDIFIFSQLGALVDKYRQRIE